MLNLLLPPNNIYTCCACYPNLLSSQYLILQISAEIPFAVLLEQGWISLVCTATELIITSLIFYI